MNNLDSTDYIFASVATRYSQLVTSNLGANK